jgi:hypothetical protein
LDALWVSGGGKLRIVADAGSLLGRSAGLFVYGIAFLHVNGYTAPLEHRFLGNEDLVTVQEKAPYDTILWDFCTP